MWRLVDAELAAIVVVNWNGHQYLEACLTAVLDQRFTDVRVVVVDNGSSDGSVEWMADHFPQVQVIPLSHNIGFAAANNLGMAAASSCYVITLNNDAQAGPGWLAALQKEIRQYIQWRLTQF